MKPYLDESWLVADEVRDATEPLREAGHEVNVSARFDPTETWIDVRVTVDGLPVVVDRMPGGIPHATFDQIAALLARNAGTLRSLAATLRMQRPVGFSVPCHVLSETVTG